MGSFEASACWAVGSDPTQGGGHGTYVALETPSAEGMRDRPSCREAQGDGAAVLPAHGRAVYMQQILSARGLKFVQHVPIGYVVQVCSHRSAHLYGT